MAGPGRRGRKLGGMNQRTRLFREILQAYMEEKNVNPHFFMVDMLADDSTIPTMVDGKVIDMPKVPMALKFQAAKELAQYLEGKKRSVIVSSEAEAPFEVRVEWQRLPIFGGEK